jgi:hypothetical protein
VLAPGLDESTILPKLVEGIRVALREGHVHPAANGWTGDATIAVRRLLDSDVLRQSLVDTPDADAAFIVPEVLYRDIVAHRYGTLDPDEFTGVEATIPAKRFSAPAWIHVPL